MNNDEDNDNLFINNMPILRYLYLIKNNYPSSELIYMVLFVFKYIGIIANTRIIEMVLNKKTISLNRYLRNFFIFGKNFSIIYKNYQTITISLAIFFLIFSLYMLICYVYIKMKYKRITSLMKEKLEKTNEKIENILLKILSYIDFTIILFHQYILEYFSFGIYAFIFYQIGIFTKKGNNSSNYLNTLNEELSDYFSDNNYLLIFIVNLFVVIFTFYTIFIFFVFNITKGLFLTHGIYSGNLKFLIFKIIITSFQPFFGIIYFYSDKAKIIFGLIISILINIICFLNFWSCFHQFGYYPSKISNICLFLEFFAFFNTIAEIILYFTGIKSTKIFFFIKLFIELINSFFLMRLFLYLKDKHNLNNFAKNLFSKKYKDISKGGLYYYMRIYLEYQKDKSNNYLKLFRILMTHVKLCKRIECPGHILIPIEYLKSSFVPTTIKDTKEYKENNLILNFETNNEQKIEKEKQDESENDNSEEEDILNDNNNEENDKKEKPNKNKKDKEDIIFDEKNKLNEKHFQIIFEQEIINYIDFLYKTKKYNILEGFVFLHLQYLFAMKKNYSLMLYYIGKYSKCGIKWSLIGQYFLYEYKQLVISTFFNKSNINNIDENANKYRKDNLFMSDVINYFTFSAILKNLVISSCSKLKLFFNYRKDLHIPIVLKSYNHSKTNKFFEIGEDIKNNINKISYFLHYHIKNLNQQNISPELSYILSNFFIFIENKIPNDLIKVLNPIFDVNIIANKLESGYKFLNLVQPLILTLSKNNNFIISYFSSVISNRLGFFQHELKNKDFHVKLFPGIQIVKQHELLMKQFLFFNNNSHIIKDTFLKTKEGYLLGVSLTAKKFPTFYEEFFIIIGIDFNDHLFFSEINKNYNRYSFLLDENLEFVFQTKNFYEDFEFNISMFKEIKANFFDFFCIDKIKFYEKLKKKNSTLVKNTGINNIYNLKKEDDAFSLFKTITYEKAYDLRDISKIESMKNEIIIIKDKISKDKIIKMIPEFSKLIEEYGLDFEWYQHLENLSKRLSLKEIKKEKEIKYSKKMVSLGLNLNDKESQKNESLIASSKNIIFSQKNYNKEQKNEYKENNSFLIDINSNNNNERKSYSSLSFESKRNDHINQDENYSKNLIDNNNIQNIKIILDRNFDVVYNLKKLGSINFYIANLYEKILYKFDDNNSLIYEPKFKFSFSRRKIEKSLRLIDSKNGSNNRIIKAKTHFSNKSKDMNDYSKVDEKKENEYEGKDIVKVRTWGNKDIKKNLIKEGERLFNNEDDVNDGNIPGNLRKNKKKRTTINLKNKINNLERIMKNEGTRKRANNYNSNYYSIHNKKKGVDNEEKITFITKDNLEEFIKKSYRTNRYLISILLILFILTVIIITIKLVFAKTNFSFTSYLTNGMIFLEEIRSDIYMGSVIVLSQCFRVKEKDLPSGLSLFPFQLAIKSSDLMNHLNEFEKQLKLTQNNHLFSNIMELLYKNIEIYHLNSDWSFKSEESYLLKEINYFSYLLNSQSGQEEENIKCNFDKTFYILFTKETRYIYNLNNKEETTFNQKFLFYIIMNIFYQINPVISNILQEIIIVQVKTMDKYLIKIIAISILLIFIIIVVEIAILLKNKLDIKFIRQIIIYLYHYEESEIQFEYEIKYLEITSKEFNLNNLKILENIKNDNAYYLNLLNKNNANEITNNNTKKNKKESVKKNLAKNNKNNLIENIINKYDKNKDGFEQNSINGSLFNNSLNNNSMVQLLNKKNNKDSINKLNDNNRSKYKKVQENKNKKKLKEEIDTNIISNFDDKLFKDNEETMELLKSNHKILPNTIFISIYISLIFFVLFFITIFINIVDIHKKRNLWEYGVNLSMNYLEKIPKIVELGLSTFLTIILGGFDEERYYPLQEFKNTNFKYMDYFSTMERYDNSELISSSIKDSLFAKELKDNYRIKKNIEFCENDEFFKNYFHNSKNWNKKLNEKNNFCINSATKGVFFFNGWIKTLDTYFEYVEQMAVNSFEENEKICESGLDLEIDLILHELTYLYIDFEERKSNITYAREKFFENENLIRMLKDMNIPFTFASGTLFCGAKEDMDELNNLFSFYEIIFIISTYLTDGIFLVFILMMISFNEKNKSILVFIQSILKKE